MSTDHRIIKSGPCELSVLEHSSKFDLDLAIDSTGTLTLASDLDLDELCEIGLKILQVALYNSGDDLRERLKSRLQEL